MVAIVTGGSKGIGFAIAQALLEQGSQVAIGARSADELAQAARRLAGGDRILTVRADVREPGDAERLVADTVRRFGGLDVLVNNAGVGLFADVADMSTEEWRQVIDTNLS